jgi:hypothetical protein
MPNLPISGLPSASVPTGVDVLPIVQGGTTSQITYNNLTSNFVTNSQTGSFATTNSNAFIGSQTITGSLLVSGSTTQIGNNTLTGNTILSGSIEVSGSTNFRNSSFTVTGSQYFTGSSKFIGDQQITGSLGVSGTLTFSGSLFINGNKQFNYGAFSSTLTQSGSADTMLSMSFNTTDVGGAGVSVIDGTKIAVTNTGVYNLQFSAQLDRTTSGTNIATIWFAYTGSSIANSATDVIIAGGAASNPVVAAWNYILPMISGSYVEIYWSHNDNADNKVELKAVAPRINPTRPAVPSVIATLTQVS